VRVYTHVHTHTHVVLPQAGGCKLAIEANGPTHFTATAPHRMLGNKVGRSVVGRWKEAASVALPKPWVQARAASPSPRSTRSVGRMQLLRPGQFRAPRGGEGESRNAKSTCHP